MNMLKARKSGVGKVNLLDLRTVVLLFTLLLFVNEDCYAGSPIRSEKSLQSALKRVRSKNVKDRIKFAKFLKKKGTEWDVWIELGRVLRLDPKNRYAKKNRPKGEPEQPKKEDKELKQARLQCNQKCVVRLVDLLDRGEKGKLTAEQLAPVAHDILSFNTNHKQARKVLGFEGKAFEWASKSMSARASKVQQVFAKVQSAKVTERHFTNLEKAMGGGFRVYKSAHAYYVTKVISDAAVIKLSRAVETAYEAFHSDFFGKSEFFKDPGRETTGVQLNRFVPAVYLILKGEDDHKRFLSKIVSDANLKVIGRKLAFCSTNFAPDKITVFESRNGEGNLKEWGALMMTNFALVQRFKMKKPIYVKNGISHFYAGLVSGDARLAVVGKGTQSDADRKSMARGSFLQLCWTARWAHENFRAPLPAQFGIRKNINGMNRGDVGLSTAFVNYLLTTDSSKLLALIKHSQDSELSDEEVFEKTFGQSRETVDNAFVKWFRNNY